MDLKQCLVIDDNEVDLLIGQAIATQMGMEATTASTVYNAFHACEENMPDVIFLDYQLNHKTDEEQMNGISVCKAIRALDGGSKPYIIIYTSTNCKDLEKESLDSGANAYVVKPLLAKIIEDKLMPN